MVYGIKPVIGPSWENFTWVGKEIFEQGLALTMPNWQSVASELISQLRQTNPEVAQQQKAAIRYIEERKGGTLQACNLIAELINPKIR
jgi:3-deoxy-D-manno-octulosonic-acid transferase